MVTPVTPARNRAAFTCGSRSRSLAEFEHHGPATIVLQHLVFAAVTTRLADGDAGDAGAEQGGLHLRQPLGADHRGDQLHMASSSLRSLPVQVRAARPPTTRRPTR